MDWELIGLIIVTVVMLCMGGYIQRLMKSIKTLVDVIVQAIEDGEVDDKELADILKYAKNLKEAILEIAKLITRR